MRADCVEVPPFEKSSTAPSSSRGEEKLREVREGKCHD